MYYCIVKVSMKTLKRTNALTITKTVQKSQEVYSLVSHSNVVATTFATERGEQNTLKTLKLTYPNNIITLQIQ